MKSIYSGCDDRGFIFLFILLQTNFTFRLMLFDFIAAPTCFQYVFSASFSIDGKKFWSFLLYIGREFFVQRIQLDRCRDHILIFCKRLTAGGSPSVQSPNIKPNEYSLFLHAMLRVISFSGNRVWCSANGIYVNPKYF